MQYARNPLLSHQELAFVQQILPFIIINVSHAILTIVNNVKTATTVQCVKVITLYYQTSTSAYYVKFLIVLLALSKTFAQAAKVAITSHKAQNA